MDWHQWPRTTATMGDVLTRGSRVHVSNGSPRGFCGYVTALYRDAATVTRDCGGRELVVLSRRRIHVINRGSTKPSPIGENDEPLAH
jgi:hypothetical protein